MRSDLEVDLEELVAQKHHSPLLRVFDPGATTDMEREMEFIIIFMTSPFLNFLKVGLVRTAFRSSQQWR